MRVPVNKGIILAGGRGSRLHPTTRAVSKQLLMVYDKPMIYYPLGVLMDIGIRDIMIIANADDSDKFRQLLGDGTDLGIKIQVVDEHEPRGIANAFLIGEDFIGQDNIALILGDNIFTRTETIKESVADFTGGGLTFGISVDQPEEYGVAEIDHDGRVLSIEEKPDVPRSNLAVTGLYVYDSQVVEISKALSPSDRGELEITDVNLAYLKQGQLRLTVLDADVVWFDTGSAESMLRAANMMAATEQSSGRKPGCLEQIAYESGYIDRAQLKRLAENMPACAYRDYLLSLS